VLRGVRGNSVCCVRCRQKVTGERDWQTVMQLRAGGAVLWCGGSIAGSVWQARVGVAKGGGIVAACRHVMVGPNRPCVLYCQ